MYLLQGNSLHPALLVVIPGMAIIERAFEIARGGKARTITDIRTQLSREGFDHVRSHLSSLALKKQLRALLKGQAGTRFEPE